tara:strand:+ start:261 stop:899 length:639 start_codon:yes stop_codon:yes gene_type:complete
MIDFILSNTDKLIAVFFLLIFSVVTIFNVSLHQQNWIRTFSGSMTLILLPIVTYSITSVISGNIALSLGMIGALSIVRFRNPVRSSFELAIFFFMISLGICAAVDLRWVFVLGASVNAIIFAVYIVNNFLAFYFKKPIFLQSFAEGNSINTLEVHSLKALENLAESPLLISFSYENEEYNYRLASSDVSLLKKISSNYSDDSDIKGLRFISG